MITEDSCSITEGRKKYTFNVYPINLHGFRKENVIKTPQQDIRVPTIGDIKIDDPHFHTYRLGRTDTRFPMTVISDFNLTDVKIEFNSHCLTGFIPSGYLKYGNVGFFETIKQNKTILFAFRWFRGDEFKGCSFKFEATAMYKCYSTKVFTKQYIYKGCQTVQDMPKELCPNTTALTTTMKPASRKVQLNHSSLTCVKYLNRTCLNTENQSKQRICRQCTEGYYNVNVYWFPQNEPFDSYQINYGPVFAFMSGFVILGQNGSSVPKNVTSYIIRNVRAGMHIGVKILKNSKSPKPVNDQTVTLQLPGLMQPSNTSSLVITSMEKTPESSSSETRDIIIAVIIPIAVMVIVLLIYLMYRRKQKPATHNSQKGLQRFELGLEVPREEKIETDEWEIMPSSFKLEDKIGEGAFGTVFSALLDPSLLSQSKYAKKIGGVAYFEFEKNPKVAVKLLKDGATSGEWIDFREEINLMKNIGYHKNIVNIIGCSTVRQPLCLVVEFMHNGDLLHYLRKRRSKLVSSEFIGGELSPVQGFMYNKNFEATLQMNQFSAENLANTGTSSSVYSTESEDSEIFDSEDVLTPDDLLTFAWQIASGMEFLSLNNMVHRDLAARNVLVGQNKLVKISDFGLTRQVGTEQVYMSSKNQKLPIKWMSCEAIFDQIFTTYSDVWAYGVVLFEIVTLGGTPYPTINNRELLNLLSSGYRMEKPQNCADPMYDIMMYCWQEDPLQRPTFTELREHLEDIMTQGSRYFSFDIDEKNVYYNVASFKSISSDDDEDDINIAERILERPAYIKTVDELRKEMNLKNESNRAASLKLNNTTHDNTYANKYFHDKLVNGGLVGEQEEDDNMNDRYTNNHYSNDRYTPTRLFTNSSVDLQKVKKKYRNDTKADSTKIKLTQTLSV